jgi:BirA family biotin operon repressor/biotin-[acetyl-CoA-carboxylase] ligase
VAGVPPADANRSATRFTDVRRYHDVDSTNRVAADLVRSGAPEGVVVVADHQTAGRGRRGRTWEAPPGSSLLVSVVLRPPDPRLSSLATFACALAAADACGDVAGFTPGLKWPNDLVVGPERSSGERAPDERKLAGVLAEAPDGSPAVVVGLGFNVCWPGPLPAHLQPVAVTAEAVAARPVDRDRLLDAYLHRLDQRWRGLVGDGEGEGAAVAHRALMDDYRRRCVTLGQAVRVTLPGGEVCAGVATAVDDDGSLLITSAGGAGTTWVLAGDVVHLRPS